MNWQAKARIMRICAALPAGGGIYKFIQKTFGRLKANPMARIPAQVEMTRWILAMGQKVEGKYFFEVGTGHCPIVPIGFFLCGAGKVTTVDLHKRMDMEILGKSLVWFAENRDEIFGYYNGERTGYGVVEKPIFDERMKLIERLKHDPEKLLSEANIDYMAPADASDTDLPDSSVDYHISTTVLEHISRRDIERIFMEAKRILKKDAMALHFIDLSDHFQHQDKNITRINFLRYSEKEWEQIAGNQFAYCNRLRANDYFCLFRDLDFDIVRSETEVGDAARESLNGGFLIDDQFSNYSADDLCTTRLRIALRKGTT